MKYALSLLFLCLFHFSHAQVASDSELFKTLYTQDSLLFGVGFNNCDISQFEALVGEDCRFFHDQSGMLKSKEAVVASIRDGLCKLNYRPRRELVEGSVQVFSLHDQGVLYGAIQTGEHRFYARYEDRPEELTSVARFTHLWLLKEKNWRLATVLSYDHRTP